MKLLKKNLPVLLVTLGFLLFSAGYWAAQSRLMNDTPYAVVERTAPAGPPASSEPTPTIPPLTPGSINLNTATAEELTRLPGIGEVLARRIVDYRSAHGPFSSVDGLLEVEGLGEKRVEAIRAYLILEENDENSGS